MIEIEGSNEIEELEITDGDLTVTTGDIIVTEGNVDIVHANGKLILPQKNDPGAPSISFGDGDSGFYEKSDDTISISISGSRIGGMSSHGIYAHDGTNIGGLLKASLATTTNPVLLPVYGDMDTGIGANGLDSLSLITGGVESQRITEIAGAIAHVLTGNVATPTTQTLTGAGAVDIVSAMTLIVTTAANALTLADGAEGQEKFIVMKTDAADGTLTPAHLKNGTTITFDDVGDSAHLIFMDGAWVFMGGTATLA